MESFHINFLAFLHLLLLSLSLFSGHFLINCSALGQCVEAESTSLLQLKQGFSYFLFNTWIPGTNCCNWEGVTCDEWSRVISLDLSNQGLDGEIPPTIGQLTSLQVLNMSHNYLTGIGIFAFLGLFKPLIQQVNRKNSSWRSILHFPQHVF
ncbi:receptor-like protein Cf-9 homolog isoform X5 [Dendrobium catenatum]|uniref:receptor-like protein Cf-9 homolog isoform X5 n=1 Tax=Dendrobium catenatum TaxID=906689 RepID=UPI00109F9EB4|nr:receptor-like protein Cf-9 homolog isoform X5 [Dendrobium catenatum]